MKSDDTNLPGYQAVLSQKNGTYRFHISELGIVASGADLVEAHRALEQKKQAVFDEFNAAGLTDELPAPKTSEPPQDKAAVRGFAIRALIVTAAALVIVGATMFGARTVITASIDAVKINPGGIHMKIIEDKLIATLHAAADPRNDYSAEKREKVIESLRTLVERYKPFFDEVRPLISGDEAAKPPHAAPGN